LIFTGTYFSKKPNVITMEQVHLTPVNYPSEQEVKDRQQGVETIAQKIQCIKEIYQDLSELVEEQGQSIDTIESKCESSSTTAQAGLTQIQAASKNQRWCVLM
jgi:hypothetical protein